MVSKRRRSSMPPSESQPTISTRCSDVSESFTTAGRSSSSPDQPHQRVARLDERAAHLAAMTSELHFRMLADEVKGMEKGMKALVHKTATDEEFRSKNEDTMQKIWTEMMSVKQQSSNLDATQTNLAEDFKKLQEETTKLIEEYRTEFEHLKNDLRDVTTKMNSHAVCLGTYDDSGYESLGRELSFAEYVDQKPALDKSASKRDRDITFPNGLRDENAKQNTQRSIQGRIRDTVQSTKRWHREHKGTELPDPVFCANYLKQQSKRDAEVAVLIQRSLSKRIRERGQQQSRPNSIEEFCTDVTWKDVLEVAQTVLVNDEPNTRAELAGKRI